MVKAVATVYVYVYVYKATHHKAQGHEWFSFIQVIEEGSSICVSVQGPAHRMLHSAWPPLLLINCPQLKERKLTTSRVPLNISIHIHSYSFPTDCAIKKPINHPFSIIFINLKDKHDYREQAVAFKSSSVTEIKSGIYTRLCTQRYIPRVGTAVQKPLLSGS